MSTLLEVADWTHAGVATFCTGPDGDPHGNLCLCHWSPWVDRAGFPAQDHKPLVGDPLADVPVAEPWQPQRRRGSRMSPRR